jgi:hypothetical protein
MDDTDISLQLRKAVRRQYVVGLKTCMRLKVSFYEFLGARLGVPGPQIPPLAELIRLAPS